MKTLMLVLQPNGDERSVTLDLPEKPNYDQLKKALEPYFKEAYTEHVNVLTDEGYTDMFVDEDGFTKHLQRNEKATKLYRNNWLKQHPHVHPESMNYIVGPAVIFNRRVWY